MYGVGRVERREQREGEEEEEEVSYMDSRPGEVARQKYLRRYKRDN